MTSSKKISKIEKPQTKEARFNKLKQLRENKKKALRKGPEVTNDNMLHDAFVDILEKGPNPPRIILLAPFNNAANPNLIK